VSIFKFAKLATSPCTVCREWGGEGKMLTPDDGPQELTVEWKCGHKVIIGEDGMLHVVQNCSEPKVHPTLQ